MGPDHGRRLSRNSPVSWISEEQSADPSAPLNKTMKTVAG